MKIKIKAFTLVEMIITIALVVILSTLSVPIYRKHVVNAKKAEGYTLLAQIKDSQLLYYSEYRRFFTKYEGQKSFEEVLGIDARGNKYYSLFQIGGADGACFYATVWGAGGRITLGYNRTTGSTTAA
ncbi:MAG: prepilin-type N-terminal cleavage/methylation domain-containing protein [Elusimicrobia bacterium]|nr:prepilin-type N-terminal cleavage/methylation domain-containing protein [Elusimicrobiota bacterium]